MLNLYIILLVDKNINKNPMARVVFIDNSDTRHNSDEFFCVVKLRL